MFPISAIRIPLAITFYWMGHLRCGVVCCIGKHRIRAFYKYVTWNWKIKLRIYSSYPSVRIWLVANGCIKASMMHMEDSRNINHVMLLKVSPKKKESTIHKLLCSNFPLGLHCIKPSMMQMEDSRNIKHVLLLKVLETFTPFARIDSIQMILSIATSLNWEVHLTNVKSVFSPQRSSRRDLYVATTRLCKEWSCSLSL